MHSGSAPLNFRRPTMVAGFLSLCLAAPAAGLAATVEERLQQMEQSIAALQEENAALKSQLGYDAKGRSAAVVTAIGKGTRFAIGGFLHLNGEIGDAADLRFPANDRFLMRKARLGVKGTLSESVDFSMQADLGSNSLGSTAGYRVQAADVVVVWKAHPAANVTIGQFKTPYGYEQMLGDTKMITIERALASDQLTLGRQAGAMVSGGFFNKTVNYAASVSNGSAANSSFNDNEQFAYTGRLGVVAFSSPNLRITTGAGAFTSRDTGTFTGRRTGESVDVQFAFAGAEFDAEWLQTRFDRDAAADYEARGWSLMGSCFLVPNRWQVFARYETYDPSTAARADETDLRTVGLNYFIRGDDLRLSLNYLIGNPPGVRGQQNRLIGRVQLIF